MKNHNHRIGGADMDVWIGIFIWLCGAVMGFATAIIITHLRDDIEEEELGDGT